MKWKAPRAATTTDSGSQPTRASRRGGHLVIDGLSAQMHGGLPTSVLPTSPCPGQTTLRSPPDSRPRRYFIPVVCVAVVPCRGYAGCGAWPGDQARPSVELLGQPQERTSEVADGRRLGAGLTRLPTSLLHGRLRASGPTSLKSTTSIFLTFWLKGRSLGGERSVDGTANAG